MNEKSPQSEPTQKTPKGVEIPVPKRADVLRDLAKVAPPVKSSPAKRGDDERT